MTKNESRSSTLSNVKKWNATSLILVEISQFYKVLSFVNGGLVNKALSKLLDPSGYFSH
jgi:hypothetical protein